MSATSVDVLYDAEVDAEPVGYEEPAPKKAKQLKPDEEWRAVVSSMVKSFETFVRALMRDVDEWGAGLEFASVLTRWCDGRREALGHVGHLAVRVGAPDELDSDISDACEIAFQELTRPARKASVHTF